MDVCVTHNRRYRCRLEFVINQLRTVGTLTAYQSVKIGSYLCTCQPVEITNANPDSLKFPKTDEKQVHRKLDTLAISENNEFPKECAKVITDILESLRRLNEDAHRKLIILVDKILRQEVNEIIPKSDNPGVNDRSVVNLAVELPWRYTGLFVGKRGSGFEVAKQKSSCTIDLDRAHDSEQVLLRISGETSRVNKACSILKKRAKEIVEKRKQHEQRVTVYQQRKSKIRMANMLASWKNVSEFHGACENIKNLNRGEYHRQKYARGRTGHGKVKGHRLLAEGSRCLNCLQTFVAMDMKKVACKYHPGFIVNDHWTCCGVTSTDHHPSHADHTNTGCRQSVHNWRPTQKRQGKHSLNSAMESQCSLLQEGTATLRDLKLSNS